MRRAIAVLAGLAAALVAVAPAHAGEQETPQGRMSAPNRAPAGSPIWVRSITPCPSANDGQYRFVRVGISPQSNPDDLSYVESTDGDLRSDGSWEVTLSAPTDMANGITKSYTIHAQCIVNLTPYATPDDAGDTTTTTESTTTTTADDDSTTTTVAEEEEEKASDPNKSYFRYFYRKLYVTGFSSTGGGEGGEESAELDDSSSSSEADTEAQSFSDDSELSAQSSSSDDDTYSAAAVETTDATWVDDEAARAAEARAELAAQGVDVSDMSDEEVLLAYPAASARDRGNSGGGIPWWSFALATMLAVGAVVAWGTRRADEASLWAGPATTPGPADDAESTSGS